MQCIVQVWMGSKKKKKKSDNFFLGDEILIQVNVEQEQHCLQTEPSSGCQQTLT